MSLIRAARGLDPVDLLIRDVRVVHLMTGEILPAEIAIHGERIAGVEPPGSAPRRPAHRTLDGGGRLVVPGLVDSHMHIESSLLTPAHFAAAVLPRGVTTVAADPHEVANATGLAGIRHYYEAGRHLPLDIRWLVPTCVPAAAGLETCRGTMGAGEVTEMLGWEDVLGLAEVMDARAVVEEEPRMRAILAAGRQAGGIIEGHNPMLEGRDLDAFVAAGVDSDHTLATPERVVQKLRLGVTVQLQERYMSEAVVAAINALPMSPDTLCLVTDDVAPDTLQQVGHLDQVLRCAISLGMAPFLALRAATLHPARRLRLFDRGVVAPGRRADLALVGSLDAFDVSTTISGGRVVVDEGRLHWEPPTAPTLDALRDSLDLEPPPAAWFRPALPDGEHAVRVILSHPHGTTTGEGTVVVQVRGGSPLLLEHADLSLATVIARGGATRFTGFIQGLGLRRGAIATTHAHDSHNLAVIGRDAQSMATAAAAVIGRGGGIAVAEGKQVRALLPLPLAGVVSDRPLPEVAEHMRQVTTVLAALGVQHPYLLMRLTTFTLPVSTGLRITDLGYVRAAERALVPLVA